MLCVASAIPQVITPPWHCSCRVQPEHLAAVECSWERLHLGMLCYGLYMRWRRGVRKLG